MRISEARIGDNHTLVDAYIPCATALNFFLRGPKNVLSSSDGNPSALAFFLMLTPMLLVPFQLRYGWKQIAGRIAMIAAGAFAILNVVYGPLYRIAFITDGTLECIALMCGWAFTHTVIAKGWIDDRYKQWELFVEGHGLHLPFNVIDLTAESAEIKSIEEVIAEIHTSGFERPTIFEFPVAYSKEDSCYCITEDHDKCDFIIIGVSFTSFDFLICHLALSKRDAAISFSELNRRMHKLALHMGQRSEIRVENLLQLKIEKAGAGHDLCGDPEFRKSLRMEVRLGWGMHSKLLKKLPKAGKAG